METSEQRSARILGNLKAAYPKAKSFDLDGRGEHFVCEVEPTQDHPAYDVAIEVIISSRPHKHQRSTQYYEVLSGTLTLHLDEQIVYLQAGQKFSIAPGIVHWGTSNDECCLKIRSEPGWTAEDHIPVELSQKYNRVTKSAE